MLPLSPLTVGLRTVESDLVKLRKSQTEAVSSADPLKSKNSLNGEKSSEYISFVWATI